MPDSSRTLGDVEDIDSAELKTQLKNWIEEEGIEANIQLQMKKNLIDKMSRTALGKKIALKLQTQHGIVLSPLVLVLNTLVAEFLYTQNCHFSLSIFTNEVPFKNTLPDFTRSSKFRLNRTELGEIFEALGIEHYDGLVEKYEKFGTDQGSRSLLYIVFKSVLSAVKTQDEKLRRLQRHDRRKATARTMLKQLEVEKLHRNVEKLLHRVKAVAKAIAELERNQQATIPGDPGEHNKPAGEDDSAHSLRVCSENVSKLVERLESCTKMFEQLIDSVRLQRNEDIREEVAEAETNAQPDRKPNEKRKTYTEFLHELKTTEHGKKYVAKLQKQVAKLLDKEKQQMGAKHERELRKLELEYGERLEKALASKHLEPRTSPPPPPLQRAFPPGPQLEPVAELNSEESQHFMRKIDEKLDQLYRQERNVDDKLSTLRNDLQRQEQRQSRYFESLKAAKTKESKLQVLHTVERELMATFEDETNTIIQNAKQTIEQLERESDKINHSFQRYLRKQREDKRKLIDEKVQIWARYNDEKLELNQRELLNGDQMHEGTKVPSEGAPIVSEVTIPIQLSERETPFENPFRAFDPLKYLKHSRPFESHTVDVAIGTTSDTGQQTSREEDTIVPVAAVEKPVPAVRANNKAHLTDALAKDTQELRKSIEENLQKLDHMSRTYSKSNSSSELRRTFDVVPQPTLPTVEPATNRSLDDCSSTELGLSDGEIVLPVVPVQLSETLAKLNTTQDLLDYASQNDRNEQADGQSVKLQPLAASYSDLSIGSISGTTWVVSLIAFLPALKCAMFLRLFRKYSTANLTHDLRLYDGRLKDKVQLQIQPNKPYISFYTCGPTVYDVAHIGHASCYVRLDIIQRILRHHFRFPLVTAMNVTDIDDKIIVRARERNTDWQQLARRNEEEFWSDLKQLNIRAPDVKLRVTDHIPEIIRFIQTLVHKGFAYGTADGSVYFETSKYERYGKLQKVIIEPANAPKSNSDKRHPSDFALWKASKAGEPYWTCPDFGNGRPGWHIECSTLATHLFGSTLDFHAGGLDLRFPHHENEETQSCCYHNVHDWVTHWLHTGQLHLEGQTHKMSKSLKNTITISELLQEHSADEFRMLCLLSHYRSVIEYGPETMATAWNVLRKFTSFFSDVKAHVDGLKPAAYDATSTDNLLSKLTATRTSVKQFLSNDFNTTNSVLALGELASNVQRLINSGEQARSSLIGASNVGAVLAVSEYIRAELTSYGLESLNRHASEASSGGVDQSFEQLIDAIVSTRTEIRSRAMASKNAELFQVCDLLRDRLKESNVELKDHGKTSSWSILQPAFHLWCGVLLQLLQDLSKRLAHKGQLDIGRASSLLASSCVERSR
uniref:cysteine--tRNA ligase n=1 Tax=Anopheles dirus TaxID=7168 RepID=A0A182NSY3_9DIPT